MELYYEEFDTGFPLIFFMEMEEIVRVFTVKSPISGESFGLL